MRFPFHARRIRKDAAWWHMRMLEPRSDAEVDAFEKWLAKDPAHAREYAAVAGTRELALKTDYNRSVRQTERTVSHVWRPALALMLAVLAIATVVIVLQGSASPAFARVANDGPAVRGVRLKDATVVWMDVGSEMGVRFSKELREIAVRRGRLRVTPGRDSRPLEITAGDLRVLPGQTTIDVEAASDGNATVGALDGGIVIELTAVPGQEQQQLRIEQNHALTMGETGTRNARIDRSWPAARLRFSDVPLSRIAVLANRGGDPDVLILDPQVADLRVSGVFDLRDTASLGRKLAAAHDLRVVTGPGGIELHR